MRRLILVALATLPLFVGRAALAQETFGPATAELVREGDNSLRLGLDERAKALYLKAIEHLKQTGKLTPESERDILRRYCSVTRDAQVSPCGKRLLELDGQLPTSLSDFALDRYYYAHTLAYQKDELHKQIALGLQEAEESGDLWAMGLLNDYSGIVANRENRVDDGIVYWSKAVEIFGKLPETPRRGYQLARALVNLAERQLDAGEFKNCLASCYASIDVSKRCEEGPCPGDTWSGFQAMLEEAYSTLGEVQERFGNAEEAIHSFKAAIASEDGAEATQSSAHLTEMAHAYWLLGRPDDAKYCAELALSGNNEENDPFDDLGGRLGYAGLLNDLGQEEPDPDKRRELGSDALTLVQEGAIHLAKHSFQMDAAVRLHLEGSRALLLCGEPDAAMDELRKCESPLSLLSPTLRWQLDYDYGRALESKHDLGAALGRYQGAVNTILELLQNIPENTEQATGAEEEMWAPFERLALGYVSANELGQAFRITEELKAGLLMKGTRTAIELVLSPEDREQERTLRSRYADLRQRIASGEGSAEDHNQERAAERDYRSFLEKVYAANPKARLVSRPLPPISGLSQAQELAREIGATILDYAVLRDSVYLFVIPARGAVLSNRLPVSAKDLRTRVDRFVHCLSAPQPLPAPYWKQDAQQLYAGLLSWAESHVAKGARLCVIPDSFLWSLPFEALIDSAGSFELVKHSFTYAPSVAALDSMGKESGATRVAFFAHPNLTGASKALLRGEDYRDPAASEVEGAKALLGSAATTFQGRKASSANGIKALGAFPIVHFAVHGLYDDYMPFYSALKLRGADYLEARDLAAADIKSDLVVLAACETGKGRPARGQGLEGMPWAATLGGAKACIATRWSVHDDATGLLFTDFYKRLKQGDMPSAALRMAQIELAKSAKFSNPTYWAGVLFWGR